MWKKIIVDNIKILTQYLLEKTEDSKRDGRDSNPGPSNYDPLNYECRLFERDVLWERKMTCGWCVSEDLEGGDRGWFQVIITDSSERTEDNHDSQQGGCFLYSFSYVVRDITEMRKHGPGPRRKRDRAGALRPQARLRFTSWKVEAKTSKAVHAAALSPTKCSE